MVCLIRGKRTRYRIAKTIAKASAPMISSVRSGISGLGLGLAASARNLIVRPPLPDPSCGRFGGRSRVVEDERDHEADQRQRLGQREPDVHVGADQSG